MGRGNATVDGFFRRLIFKETIVYSRWIGIRGLIEGRFFIWWWFGEEDVLSIRERINREEKIEFGRNWLMDTNIRYMIYWNRIRFLEILISVFIFMFFSF